MWTDRTKVLIGEKGLQKLSHSHIAVIGVGGVGGYVCLMLARAGIGQITLVDFDVVDETNLNRQVVANIETIGSLKVDIMKDMLLKINPKLKVNAVSERLTANNISEILKAEFDFVVDAIDSVQDKVELICYSKINKIPIVSAMGSGNRIGIPDFKVIDIYKTSNDGLAKVMRKKLREREIADLTVVTSQESVLKHKENVVGSISYYPAMCGCVLSAYVIEYLFKH